MQVLTLAAGLCKLSYNTWRIRNYSKIAMAASMSPAALEGQLMSEPLQDDEFVPFGIRALESGVEVEGVWISDTHVPRPGSPASSTSSYKLSISYPDSFLGNPRPSPHIGAPVSLFSPPPVPWMPFTGTKSHSDNTKQPSFGQRHILTSSMTRSTYSPRFSHTFPMETQAVRSVSDAKSLGIMYTLSRHSLDSTFSLHSSRFH